jgi:hypothetical protein
MTELSDVIGTWTLVNWASLKNGEPAGYPMGEDAHGQIIYSTEGRMAASLMRQDFKEHPSTTNPTADTCLCYGGTFRLEGDQVVHDVIYATLPHWIGKPLKRTVVWQDGDLLLNTAPETSKSGNTYQHELRWRKL